MTSQESPTLFGVLLAGSTPEVNEVQIHQDKLGEYTRTGGTLHGRPAYKKDNNTNHMLWFCFASDGTPTWYVGKEEFGQARGWLQVKSDAQTRTRSRTRGAGWSVTERRWKEAADVKCIAVSATAGVIIHGPTPSNLLQDKLGEYRRVQLRVITERGVYEMVGMPNVMMWYAPGGTWNIGKRTSSGRTAGGTRRCRRRSRPRASPTGRCARRPAPQPPSPWRAARPRSAPNSPLHPLISDRLLPTPKHPPPPLLLCGMTWRFCARSRWGRRQQEVGEGVRPRGDLRRLKAHRLHRRHAQGRQPGQARRVRAQPGTFCELRAVYQCVDVPSRSIWYTKPYWYVGKTDDIGKAQGWLCCKDDAPCPELTKATWRVSDGTQMVDAADVKCMPVGATTVMVAGETPNDLNSDKLGEFQRRIGHEVNGRPIYAQVGNDNRMIWYAAGYWYLGKKNELGKSQGWLCVRDLARARARPVDVARRRRRAAPPGAQRALRGHRRAHDRGARRAGQRAAQGQDGRVPDDRGDGGQRQARLREGALRLAHGVGLQRLLVRRQARRARQAGGVDAGARRAAARGDLGRVADLEPDGQAMDPVGGRARHRRRQRARRHRGSDAALVRDARRQARTYRRVKGAETNGHAFYGAPTSTRSCGTATATGGSAPRPPSATRMASGAASTRRACRRRSRACGRSATATCGTRRTASRARSTCGRASS